MNGADLNIELLFSWVNELYFLGNPLNLIGGSRFKSKLALRVLAATEDPVVTSQEE